MTSLSLDQHIDAVLFDMDGTLIESEDRTDHAITELLSKYSIDTKNGLELARYHGVTWAAIAQSLVDEYPIPVHASVALDLQRAFHQTFVTQPPNAIPGAVETIRRTAQSLPVGIVTSSNDETLTLVCDQLKIRDLVSIRVCAEDCIGSKPSPEPYVLAAKRLNVNPNNCLIFEDSAAGVSAGLAAGAMVIAVGSESGHKPWIKDFLSLPSDFFTYKSEQTYE